VAWGWLAERQPAETAREILTAAEGMSPLLRVTTASAVVGSSRRAQYPAAACSSGRPATGV